VILPATINFQAVAGGTFDAAVTLMQGTDELHYEGQWDETLAYSEDALVLTDDVVYAANSDVPAGIDPPGDTAHVHWRTLDPVDLTGWSASLQIGDPAAGGSLLVDSSGPELTIGGTSGRISILLSPAQTTALLGGWHYYVQTTDAATNIYFPFSGKLKVSAP
jgi:hypothetical protein